MLKNAKYFRSTQAAAELHDSARSKHINQLIFYYNKVIKSAYC
jgi:hypothetical protein